MGQIGELRMARQELDYLEGCRPHIPRGQVCGMCGTAEKVGHRLVGGVVGVGTCGVVGPAYGVDVGLELLAISGEELGEGTSSGQGTGALLLDVTKDEVVTCKSQASRGAVKGGLEGSPKRAGSGGEVTKI